MSKDIKMTASDFAAVMRVLGLCSGVIEGLGLSFPNATDHQKSGIKATLTEISEVTSMLFEILESETT